jgi:hypothetical protein
LPGNLTKVELELDYVPNRINCSSRNFTMELFHGGVGGAEQSQTGPKYLGSDMSLTKT